jgi:hypothetical protein
MWVPSGFGHTRLLCVLPFTVVVVSLKISSTVIVVSQICTPPSSHTRPLSSCIRRLLLLKSPHLLLDLRPLRISNFDFRIVVVVVGSYRE